MHFLKHYKGSGIKCNVNIWIIKKNCYLAETIKSQLLSDATLYHTLAHPVIPASCEQELSSPRNATVSSFRLTPGSSPPGSDLASQLFYWMPEHNLHAKATQ